MVYTYTNAEFDSDFDSDFFGAVQDGDRLPYIPEHQLGLGVSVEYDRYAIGFDAHYVDAMATVAGSSGARPGSNTDSYFVVDAKASAQISDELEAFVSIKNLFDEEYVVARRPAGARPGIPLMVFAGVSVELG